MIDDTHRQLEMDKRQAFLMLVDGIERALGIQPRTAELRRIVKDWQREQGQPERSAERGGVD